MWWLTAVALATEPSAHLTWKGADGRLLLRAPDGEHVAEDAPLDVDLAVGDRAVTVRGLGVDAADGVPLGDLRGRKVAGEVRLSLCEDEGTRCRITTLAVAGAVPDQRRGTLILTESLPNAPSRLGGYGAMQDAEAIYARALAQAAEFDSPVLLDFGAVWCPPCQLMATELFDAEPRPSVVDAFVIAVLDVDDPSSWALKDRFAVGGYPTLVAVDGSGAEIGRLVGYPGFDPTVAWMDEVVTGRLLRPTDDPTPAEAAVLAWRAIREEREDDAKRLLAVAAVEPERAEVRLTRFRLEPTTEDALWLEERAVGLEMSWVPFADALAKADPVAAAAVLRTVTRAVPTATPDDAADLLAVAAGLQAPDAARLSYAAAARLVQSRLVGDLERDKGRLGWLAWLLHHAGDVRGAQALLDQARAAFPTEPTFHTSAARLYLEQGQNEEALAAAEVGYEAGWGDNRLTAAVVKVKALLGLKRVDEARSFVQTVLAEQAGPDQALDVRSHRYRQQLLDLVGGP